MPSSLILTLVYRLAGAWGAGKGANLTAAEFDGNQWELQQAIEELADNPAQPKNIQEIEVTGNQMTITLDDGVTTFGPFTLPRASLIMRGDWTADTAYLANDIFRGTADDVTGAYIVNRDFTSGSTFVPDLGAGIGGASPYASLLVEDGAAGGGDDGGAPTILSGFVPGRPGEAIAAPATILGFVADADMWFGGSDVLAVLDAACTDDLQMVVAKNGDALGTLDFASGTATGTVTMSPPTAQLAAGDRLRILAPDPFDSTAAGLYVAVPVTRGTIPIG